MLLNYFLQTPTPIPVEIISSPPQDDATAAIWMQGTVELIQSSFTFLCPIYTIIIIGLVIRRIISARV